MQLPVELKKKYLDRRIEDIKRLKTALEQDDFSFAFRMGHQLKGNAVTFEFPQMASIGVEIERAALRRDKEKIRFFARKMENVVFFASEGINAPVEILAN